MALIYDIIKTPPKALTFDVFGTVVDWRTTLVSTLIQNATAKISASSTPTALSPEVRERLSGLTEDDWGQFAQEWRNSYKKFTLGYNPEKMEWRDIDTHHHQSLIDLLKQWKLETLYSEAEVKELSRIWHFLDPWADSSAGLHKLGTKFITSTLSNGTRQLLRDLNVHCDLGFQMIQSSEDFKAYKPHAR
jgi:2-haloacid dehalogenase